MSTSDDLRFGRKPLRQPRLRKLLELSGHNGIWTNAARERYREAVSERLRALKALSEWRGGTKN